MTPEEFVIIDKKLDDLENLLRTQNLLQKNFLTVEEACIFLDLKPNHLYKLTSKKMIPHFCPNGKKLYFKRTDLEDWILKKPIITDLEIEKKANEYLNNKKDFS